MIIGFFEENITPPPGFPLGGYIERFIANQRAKGKLNDIFVRAMYLRDSSSEYLLLSADLLLFENTFVAKARRAISDVTGVPAEHIMLTATHTHSAPNTASEMILFSSFYSEEDMKLTKKYNEEFLLPKLVEVSENAKSEAREGRIFIGRDEVDSFCTNRIDPILERDKEVIVIIDDRRRGGIVSFTCHPTVLGADNLLYSGDFISFTNDTLKKCVSSEFIPLFLNGAAGDQSTRFVRRSQSVEEAKRIGKILGRKICEMMDGLEELSVDKIIFKHLNIELNVRDLEKEKFRERIERRITEIDELMKKASSEGEKRKLSQDLMTAHLILGCYEGLKRFLKRYGEKVTIPVDLLAISDDVLMVFLPLELFCRYGLEIKKKSGFKYTIIACYSNGYYGYLPTKEAFEHFDYESLMSIFTPEAGEKLVREVLLASSLIRRSSSN